VASLPRAKGTPDAAAAKIVEAIRNYARQTPSHERDANIERIRGLHHIFDAARDSLDVGLAVVNAPGPGKVSYRKADAEIGIHWDTVKYHVDHGKALLAEEKAA
jgi:tellurite resistance protein